ncbi:MAG: hypothetical protein JNL79_06430 [Myxococcales bacterium]|nr:hypothetical protein [Myxococcales bacterium]
MSARLAIAVAVAVVTAASSGSAQAQFLRADAPDAGGHPAGPARPKGGDQWDGFVWLRGRVTLHPAWPLDRAGFADPQKALVETRVRLGFSWGFHPTLAIATELDGFPGVVAGDTSDLGTAEGRFEPRYRTDRTVRFADGDVRQLFLTWRLPFGELRLGRMAFSWGLGMVANDGRGEADFGDRRHGDLMDRVVFATRPFARSESSLRGLAVFVGADRVFRDENADFRRGDTAYQGVFGLRYEHPADHWIVGAFGAYRRQTDRVEPGQGDRRAELNAFAVDVYAKLPLMRGPYSLVAEAELAVTRGDTTRTLFEATRTDGADVAGHGSVLRLVFDDWSRRFRIKTEVGYASGDADPYDGVARNFSFDPDYKVGLLLFDPLLGRLSGRGVDRASDPSLVATPPAGVRFLGTQGAITNATYVNAVARFRPTAALDLRLGWVVAGSAVGLSDAFETAQRGGYLAGFDRRPASSRLLGHEVDVAVLRPRARPGRSRGRRAAAWPRVRRPLARHPVARPGWPRRPLLRR